MYLHVLAENHRIKYEKMNEFEIESEMKVKVGEWNEIKSEELSNFQTHYYCSFSSISGEMQSTEAGRLPRPMYGCTNDIKSKLHSQNSRLFGLEM